MQPQLQLRLAVCAAYALGFGLAMFACVASAAAAEIAVVASAKSTAGTLSAEQAPQVFVGKASAFADGHKTVLLDQGESAPCAPSPAPG